MMQKRRSAQEGPQLGLLLYLRRFNFLEQKLNIKLRQIYVSAVYILDPALYSRVAFYLMLSHDK